MDLKELIAILNVADRLKSPPKTDKRLGPSKDTCLALGFQLDELLRNGFLKEYLQEPQRAPTSATPAGDQGHEVPIHGEINTISGGFSGGGCSASQRKKYRRSTEVRPDTQA